MSWLSFAVISAALIGAYEVSRKAAVDRAAPTLVLLSATLGGLFVLAPLALLTQAGVFVDTKTGFALAPLSPAEHVLVLLKALLVSLSWVLTYSAVRHLPISIASPVRAAAPFFTLLFALVVYGEAPRPLDWLGMALLFGGYFRLSLVAREEGVHFSSDRWVFALVLGTLFGAASGIYDKYLLQFRLLPPTTLQFWFTFYAVILQAVFLLREYRRKQFALRVPWLAPLAGVLLVLADQFYLRAMANPEALVSIVALTRRSSVIVSFVLGGLLFREKQLKRKALALCLVVLGVATLALAR